MELASSLHWRNLDTMASTQEPPSSIRIARIGAEQAASAFAFAQEYFAAASVVARENLQQFIHEYFCQGAGWWHAYPATIEDQSQPIGCVGLRYIALQNAPGERSSEIKRMYVQLKYRSQGIAEKLLHTAEHFAHQSGYSWIYLDTTDEMKAAARLYLRNGYQFCERYNQNPQATIFLRKRLNVKEKS